MAPTRSVTHLDASPRRTEKIIARPRWTRLEVRGVWAASKGGLEGVDGVLESDRTTASSFPFVSGFPQPSSHRGACEQLRSVVACNKKQRSLSSRSCCAHQRLRNGTREHTPLKNTHCSPSNKSNAARARRHTAASRRGPTAQHHISPPRRHAQADEPHRARAIVAARPSAGNHHHHFCLTTMTTKHERRTSPRRNMHTKLKSSSSRNTDA